VLSLESAANSGHGTVALTDVRQGTVGIPGASTSRVGALITGEVVDQDTSRPGVVQGASAARAGARSGGGAVGLFDVQERTVLVIPSASTIGEGALVPREEVDQDTSVTVVVDGAGAATSTAGIASNKDGVG